MLFPDTQSKSRYCQLYKIILYSTPTIFFTSVTPVALQYTTRALGSILRSEKGINLQKRENLGTAVTVGEGGGGR